MLSSTGSHTRVLITLLGVALFVFTSCSDKIVNDGDDDNYVEEIKEAHDSLGALFNVSFNSYFDEDSADWIGGDSTFRPRDIDFSGAHALYRDLLRRFPDSTDPKFGAALTGVLVFLGDPGFNTLIDQFKREYDSLEFDPFNRASLIGGLNVSNNLSPAGLPLGPKGLWGVMPSPIALEHAIAANAAATPMISDLQSNLNNNLRPKLEQARSYMVDVLADPGYTFALTPEMQGNTGADTLFFDAAVFEAVLATLYAAEAALHIFFARDLDLPLYTPDSLAAVLDTSRSFLTLKPGGVGATHMSTAGDGVCSAQVHLSAAVDSLLSELDSGKPQSRDFFKVFESDRPELEEVQDSLLSLHSSLTGGSRWLTLKMDNGSTLTIEVDLMKFFNAPIDDFKDYVPPYTVSITGREDFYKDFAAQHYSRAEYWRRLDSAYGITQPYDTPFVPIHMPDTDTDEFYRIIGQDRYDSAAYRYYMLGWDDLRTWMDVFPFQSWRYWRYHHYYDTPNQIVACYSWSANTYAEWEWPHPTFNDLLPQMTSPQIRDILLNNLAFHWSKSECDTFDIDFDWPDE